ncbi:MAG: hypothetical protein COA57_02555 [Flavobacteriales bacterium]|nr:MAG: hypothetical protein COA57_02555 [Flavobacteriales bacterium]
MKKFLIVLLVIVVILGLVTLVLPSEISVERSALINASPSTVFEEVNVLKNWDHWSPWKEKDPTIKNTYSSVPETGVGSWTKWTSEEEGGGKLTILESEEPTHIKNQLDFEGMGTSYGEWDFKATENGTEVTWSFTGDMGYLGRIFPGLLMDGMIGPEFEKGLANLKEHCESKAEKAEVQVEEVTIEQPMWFVGIRDSVNTNDMKTIHGKIYGEISAFMQEKGIKQIAAPLSIFHVWPESGQGTVHLEIGIPVQDSVETTGRITMGKVMPGKTVMTTHFGLYDNLGATHMLLNEWMRANNVTVAGAPWEVYVTDPGNEPDTSKWQTQIFYPVQ